MVHSTYRVACLREASNELMVRSKMRDGWLRLHLFAQAAVLALAIGIRTDLSIATPAPTYAALAPTLSFMFCLFYGVQDDLVAGLSQYLAWFSQADIGYKEFPNWHGSSMIREYYSRGWAPKMKLLGLLIAFVAIPGMMAGYWLSTTQHKGRSFLVSVSWTVVILVAAAAVCILCFIRRRDLGRKRLHQP